MAIFGKVQERPGMAWRGKLAYGGIRIFPEFPPRWEWGGEEGSCFVLQKRIA